MDLFNNPTRIFDLSSLPRFCGGKPQIEKIAWFKDHIYYHKDAVLDSDNISLTLNEDSGEKITLVNGIERITQNDAPRLSSSCSRSRMTTLKTVRRDELLFRYPAGGTMMQDFPFSSVPFELTPELSALLKELEEKLDHLALPGTADKLDLLALEIFAEIRSPHTALPLSHRRVRDLYNRIMSHPGEDFNIESLVQENKMSRASFYREWQKYSSCSPYQLLLKNRLKTARWLLRQTSLSVKDIAWQAGFRSSSVFSDTFRRQTGFSPLQYRRAENVPPEDPPPAEKESVFLQ